MWTIDIPIKIREIVTVKADSRKNPAEKLNAVITMIAEIFSSKLLGFNK